MLTTDKPGTWDVVHGSPKDTAKALTEKEPQGWRVVKIHVREDGNYVTALIRKEN